MFENHSREVIGCAEDESVRARQQSFQHLESALEIESCRVQGNLCAGAQEALFAWRPRSGLANVGRRTQAFVKEEGHKHSSRKTDTSIRQGLERVLRRYVGFRG